MANALGQGFVRGSVMLRRDEDQGTALVALNVSRNGQSKSQNGNVRNTTAVECRVKPASCCDERNWLLRISHR